MKQVKKSNDFDKPFFTFQDDIENIPQEFGTPQEGVSPQPLPVVENTQDPGSPYVSFEGISNLEQELPSFFVEQEPTPELIEEFNQQLPEQGISPQFREWIEPLPNTYNLKDDNSYNAFIYLKSLGYKDCVWHLNEHHDTVDICDEAVGLTFTLDEILINASHTPPSPIFSVTHPGCKCYLTCIGPQTPKEIPDNAPGLPLYAKPNEIEQFKDTLFTNLVPINIDHMTFPPEKAHYSKFYSKSKYSSSVSEEIIKPVKILSSFRAILPLGFFRPVNSGGIGFTLEERGDLYKVFLYQLERTAEVPKELCKELVLTPSSLELSTGEFVSIDSSGTVGILLRMHSDNTYDCYVPEFDSVVSTVYCSPLESRLVE